MKTLILSGEPEDVVSIEKTLTSYFHNLEIIGSTDSSQEALKLIQKHQPDFIFLDLAILNSSSIKLIEEFRKGAFDIIFLLSQNSQAALAFAFSNILYISKPVIPAQVIDIVNKAAKQRAKNHVSEYSNIELIKNSKPTDPSTIAIINKEHVSFVDSDTIIRFQSCGSYVEVFTKKCSRHISTKTLTQYENMMERRNFIRVHRSHLINLSFIDKFIRSDGGYLLMKDGISIPVSRRFKDDFMDRVRGLA